MMSTPDYNEVRFPEPWSRVLNNRSTLDQELQREIAWGHPLYKNGIRAIAQRGDCDVVLYEVPAGDFQYAVVHLTWSGKQEPDPGPAYATFATWDAWMSDAMKANGDGRG